MSLSLDDACRQFLEVAATHKNKLPDAKLREELPLELHIKRDVINRLLAQCRIQLLKDEEGLLIYKVVEKSVADRLVGLDTPALIVYRLIESTQNKGMWIRDIRRKSHLSTIVANKIIKELIKRKLVKAEKSMEVKNRKMYMLFDLEPARRKHHCFFTPAGDFDASFCNDIYRACFGAVEKTNEAGEVCTLDRVDKFIRSISKIPIPGEDLQSVLRTLVLDGLLEEVPPTAVIVRNRNGKRLRVPESCSTEGSISYRLSRRPLTSNADSPDPFRSAALSSDVFSSSVTLDIPCLSCPKAAECDANDASAVVSPHRCPFIQQWLGIGKVAATCVNIPDW